jgi:excinuclease ABC subunit C
LDIAARNASEKLAGRRRWHQRNLSLIQNLQRILRLPRPPIRMACVDISNIQGRHAVGSLVTFTDGQPDKASYRHYRIVSKQEPDDPAMMAEVVGRLIGNEPQLAESLDLLVLDGGKGQLSRIHQLLLDLGMVDRLPLISLAKEKESDRGEKGRGFYEKIYIPGRKNPLFLSQYPDILHLLQRLRDEAHRFAISFYKNLHRDDLLRSSLDTIPGVGPRRRQMLIQHFGSIETLKQASLEELKSVPGIPESLAQRIADELREQPS